VVVSLDAGEGQGRLVAMPPSCASCPAGASSSASSSLGTALPALGVHPGTPSPPLLLITPLSLFSHPLSSHPCFFSPFFCPTSFSVVLHACFPTLPPLSLPSPPLYMSCSKLGPGDMRPGRGATLDREGRARGPSPWRGWGRTAACGDPGGGHGRSIWMSGDVVCGTLDRHRAGDKVAAASDPFEIF